jgi:hypothetical protein
MTIPVSSTLKITTATIILTLGGCNMLPRYEHPTSGEVATITKSPDGWLWVNQSDTCADWKTPRLEDNAFKIPAGKEMTIQSGLNTAKTGPGIRCFPASFTFMPEKNAIYHVEFELKAQSCRTKFSQVYDGTLRSVPSARRSATSIPSCKLD